MQEPILSLAEAPNGVPISALVFGGRRKELAPLVYEAKDWNHGVLVGASVASETTAAASGEIGVVRRDPMAMKPFCGYNFADYWGHWLSFADSLKQLPRIFHVNWFRQDDAGKFLWPGFGENLRVLRWIIDRCEDRVGARETAVGFLPEPADIDTNDLDVTEETMQSLLSVDIGQWQQGNGPQSASTWKATVSDLPEALKQVHEKVVNDLQEARLTKYWCCAATADMAVTIQAANRRRASAGRLSSERRRPYSSQMKWIASGVPGFATLPRPMIPSPVSSVLSRRTKVSSPLAFSRKVPFVLWSININLPRRFSTRA